MIGGGLQTVQEELPRVTIDTADTVVRVELRNLRAFLAVADAGSVSAAARHLHLAQPSVSEQLAHLERDVGQALFVRLGGPRGLRLTEAGQALVAPVRELLTLAARLPQQAAMAAEAPRLRLGVPVALEAELLEQLVGALDAGVSGGVLPVPSSTAQSLVGLDRGELEAGVVRLPVPSAGLVVVPMRAEALGLWLPPGHELIDLPEVPIARLSGLPVSVFARVAAPGAYDEISAVLAAAGVHPRWIELAAVDTGVPVRLLAEAAHLSTPTVAAAKAGLQWRPLCGEPLHLRSALAWRADAPQWLASAASSAARVVGGLPAERAS